MRAPDHRPVPKLNAREGRQKRGYLSSTVIVDAAIALVDEGGDDALTFRSLGDELKVSPTSVYRHFRDKDELLLAMADRLLDEAFVAVDESEDWRTTLRSIAYAMHGAYVGHARIAVLVSARTAVGTSELRVAELILRTLKVAGIPPEERALYYRAFEDTVLAWACFDATYASINPEARSRDEVAWMTRFGGASARDFPSVAETRPHEVQVNDHQIFVTAIDLVVDAIGARASGHEVEAKLEENS